MSWRPALATQGVQGQPGLHGENVSKKTERDPQDVIMEKTSE